MTGPPTPSRSTPRAFGATVPTIKPWILPTGNPFIKDAARRHARPDGQSWRRCRYVRARLRRSIVAAGRSAARLGDRGAVPHQRSTWRHGPLAQLGHCLVSKEAGYSRRRCRQIDFPRRRWCDVLRHRLAQRAARRRVALRLRVLARRPDARTSIPGGRNQLAIRLDNPPSSSRWYPGGGIYRNVWLTKTSRLHVGHWGALVRTRNVSASSATIDSTSRSTTTRTAATPPASARTSTRWTTAAARRDCGGRGRSGGRHGGGAIECISRRLGDA